MSESIRIGQAYFPGKPAKAAVPRPGAPNESSFARLLNESLRSDERRGASNLTFSQHAIARLAERNIRLDERDIARLESAVAKAAGKGARQSLVLMNKVAFVVSVANRTVITALDENHMRENVFTQIDSAVVL